MTAMQESDPVSASIEGKTIKSKVRTEKRDNQIAEAAAILNKLLNNDFRDVPEREVPPHGYPPYPSKNMASCCMKVPSEMPYVSGTASRSKSATPLCVRRHPDGRPCYVFHATGGGGGFLHCATTRSVTYQPTCSGRCAPSLAYNQVCSHSVGNHLIYAQPALKTLHEWTSKQRVSGLWHGGGGAFFDIRVFHPSAPSYRKKELSAMYNVA